MSTALPCEKQEVSRVSPYTPCAFRAYTNLCRQLDKFSGLLSNTSLAEAFSLWISEKKMRCSQDYIAGIRKAYEEDWYASDVRQRQMAVALYFIDKLALRAGHEKDEDEADTVGCCTLKVLFISTLENSMPLFA